MTTDLEAEPAAAREILGDGLERARAFAADLAEQGEELGLIGPMEAERLWSRHVLNCALVAPLLRGGSRVADVGSGAGLPGLVLAIARPDVELVLIEPMERRTAWLLAETARLALDNVTVVRARAEDAVGAGPFEQITARAVSALTKLIPLTVPLASDGGELLFLKGARVHDEVLAARAVLRRHGIREYEVLELGGDLLPEATRLFRATVVGAS
ncbi:MAG: 16S rRNA (guanine(527)-N(7))-methyltransferase RsmG [Microcella sp.]|uniref:16S rRNA (guanine(527)-N(7))-methyltransferase RsmG n=1 Tax=Microcella sp. TaxID=1913979 RepID=UPI0033153004